MVKSEKYGVCIVDIVGAEDYIRKGLKPHPEAVLYALNGSLELCSKVLVAGDNLDDLLLGENIKKRLETSAKYENVRVNNVLVNRYSRSKHEKSDYCVNNLRELANLCKSEGYDLLISDFDKTLNKWYLRPGFDAESEKMDNFLNRYGDKRVVRAFGGFALL